MDIKLANLLVGKHYYLKIADFGLSGDIGKPYNKGKGTLNYRAPEIKNGKYDNLTANDVYSAGIVLFCLATAHLPYLEEKIVKNYNLYDLLMSEDKKDYWNAFKDCCN